MTIACEHWGNADTTDLDASSSALDTCFTNHEGHSENSPPLLPLIL